MHLPIEYLSLRVVEIINKLTSLDIKTEIDKGLNPNIHYIMQMLIMLLTTWAVCCEIEDFPKVAELSASEECLNEMRLYLDRLATIAPVVK